MPSRPGLLGAWLLAASLSNLSSEKDFDADDDIRRLAKQCTRDGCNVGKENACKWCALSGWAGNCDECRQRCHEAECWSWTSEEHLEFSFMDELFWLVTAPGMKPASRGKGKPAIQIIFPEDSSSLVAHRYDGDDDEEIVELNVLVVACINVLHPNVYNNSMMSTLVLNKTVWRVGQDDQSSILKEHSNECYYMLRPAPLGRHALTAGVGNVTARDSIMFYDIGPTIHFDVSAPRRDKVESVFAIHTGHDSSFAVTESGALNIVLELERLFDVRYFEFPVDEMLPELVYVVTHSLATLRRILDWPHLEFDLCVTIKTQKFVDRMMLFQAAGCHQSTSVDHHASHAAAALYRSPFDEAVVFSYDGGGNDGLFNIYSGRRHAELSQRITRRKQLLLPIGIGYPLMAAMIPDLLSTDIRRGIKLEAWHALPGKLMAYEAMGTTRESWSHSIRQFLMDGNIQLNFFPFEKEYHPIFNFNSLMHSLDGLEYYDYGANTSDSESFRELHMTGDPHLKAAQLKPQDAKDLAATVQNAFQEIVGMVVITELQGRTADLFPMIDQLATTESRTHNIFPDPPLWDEHACKPKGTCKIILTGGCALNVKANEVVRYVFGSSNVFVNEAPNDGGLTVGAAWLVDPPRNTDMSRTSLVFSGPLLWDYNDLPHYVNRFAAQSVVADDVALLLAHGHVLGVMYGRTEWGPRALGHRSLLAFPGNETTKQLLNKIKFRAWYRPVAPIVTFEDAPLLVSGTDSSFQSPFMSFAPFMSVKARKHLPAAVHLDGSMRLQTVSQDSDVWLWSLLNLVKRATGFAVLLNTSFNVKGRPLINRISDGLQVLQDTAELFGVLIEGKLFVASKLGTERIAAHNSNRDSAANSS